MKITEPFLKTSRSIIRLPKEEDALLIGQYYQANTAHFSQFSDTNEALFSADYWQKEIILRQKQFEAGASCRLFAFTLDEQQVMAAVNFFGIIRGAFHACILGYSLSQDYVGLGLMQEILHAGIDFMFTKWHLHRIIANYHPDNVRSAKTLAALGFVKEGYAKNYLYFHGAWQDHVLTALTNNAWDAVQAKDFTKKFAE